MQDSIEDYVQFSRNGENGEKDHQDVKDKVGKVKYEILVELVTLIMFPLYFRPEVLVTVQIKKECEARAMQIIQFAIEGRMRSDALFKCVCNISINVFVALIINNDYFSYLISIHHIIRIL